MSNLNAHLKSRLKKAGLPPDKINRMSHAAAVTFISKLAPQTTPKPTVRVITLEGPSLERQTPTHSHSDSSRAAAFRQIPYREYLLTDYWNKTRLAALARAEYRCQVCYGNGRLDVHHRTYKRLGQEKQSDLTVLCETCHNLFHERLPQPKY